VCECCHQKSGRPNSSAAYGYGRIGAASPRTALEACGASAVPPIGRLAKVQGEKTAAMMMYSSLPLSNYLDGTNCVKPVGICNVELLIGLAKSIDVNCLT